MSNNTIKYGQVVILGRPNTGKSTLLNSIMEQKISITSPLPQTTRKTTRVVYKDDRGVIIFSDTPGVMGKVDDLIGKMVNKEAPEEAEKADVIIALVDASRPKSEEENKMIGIVRKFKVPKILVYNKIDFAKGSKDHLADYMYLEEEFDKVVAISALKNKHVKKLVNEIFLLLPEKKAVDTEILAEDRKVALGSNSFEFVSELIREKAYLFLRREVPYTINVIVNQIQDKKKLILVKATIFTNADRYKKMIIGKGGQKIKEIGYNARKEMETMTGRKIFLELNVATDRHWMEKVISS